VIGSLALIGGLALACFTKAFGVIFLGEPRSNYAKQAHEVGFCMKSSMIILVVICVLLGICSPWVIKSAGNVIFEITSIPLEVVQAELASTSAILMNVVIISLILLGLTITLAVSRKLILSVRGIRQAGTWDCGYAKPDARMQYTAASFSQPLTDLFKMFLRSLKKISPLRAIFPAQTVFRTDTSDISEKYMYQPLFHWVNSSLSRLRWLQQGRLQIYILYIAVTLWILLIWKLM
jgi:NADH:ubiquinone oxidoreductase subunit 5 (subunit L)/multisubunit Na+/H+ antiporter MnhA subunit